jgi:hypothetical protein
VTAVVGSVVGRTSNAETVAGCDRRLDELRARRARWLAAGDELIAEHYRRWAEHVAEGEAWGWTPPAAPAPDGWTPHVCGDGWSGWLAPGAICACGWSADLALPRIAEVVQRLVDVLGREDAEAWLLVALERLHAPEVHDAA